jgi:hypothetical protein
MTQRVVGGQKDLVSRCSSLMSKLMSFVHSEIVESVNFDSCGPLKSCGCELMVVRRSH